MTLLHDTERYRALPEDKKVLHLLQWLQGLPKAIGSAQKAELKAEQKALSEQLQAQLHGNLGPPLKRALGQAFVSLYMSGETFSLYDTVGKCCDMVRAKDEGAVLTNKLCALECLGAVYESHGRMVGTLLQETVQVLSKAMKSSDLRPDILSVFKRLLVGLGPSSTSAHKDVYKCVRSGLGDKNLAVRSVAAKCGLELAQHSSMLYTSELDSLSNSCLRALDSSSYDVRCSVAQLLGSLMALTQKPLSRETRGKLKLPSLEDVLGILANGFVRGGSGFLKGGGPELLKTGSASREVRVGVTQAYVVFLSALGGGWVERHLPLITRHILELVSHAKTTSTHIDAVYSRKCVGFVLRQVFGRLLGESAQLAAARHLSQLVSQTVAMIKGASLAGRQSKDEKSSDGGDKEKISLQQHVIICALIEIGALVYNLNTAALPLVIGDNMGVVSLTELMEHPPPLLAALSSILTLPYMAARLAAAWCMRCIGLALPSQLGVLVDYCLRSLRGSLSLTDVVSGYSMVIAGLLGAVRYCELGLPSAQAKDVLTLGQELVERGRSESSVSITQSGWSLIGAFVSLGSVYVRSQVRALLTVWRASFPHSTKEMNTELAGGTQHSWVITLESRAGALASIGSFVQFCGNLLTPELIKRLMLPLDSALAMLSSLSSLTKVHGVQIKAGAAMLRLRLYQALAVLQPTSYEGSLGALLRELVTEITLSNTLANTSTSLLRSLCHHDDSILLGSWLEETDQQAVEEQLQPNSAAGSGALEHDHCSVFMAHGKGTRLPDPLPLGVAVIDSAILLFGKAFPAVAGKHRQQLLTHFKDCVRQAKSVRQDTIQINIFTAFLAALKNLVENKVVLGQQELLLNAYDLIKGALASSEPMLRCAAGEALGRMSQVGGDTAFVAQIAQTSFDTLKSQRDVVSRTGHSLVLGCLHRYVGGMGSGQHLQMSVSILQSLTQDVASPTVQIWALHALALIADSGGPMFRNYVEPTLTLMLQLLVTTPPYLVEVHQCLAKCLSALITTLGPELQDSSRSMTTTRTTCLTCCSIVQEHPDAIVQSAAIGCLQQLQLFAPQCVTLSVLVPLLHRNLHSQHLLLRRAAANCLRQFAQREPKAVWELCPEGEQRLEYVVLARLDVESDRKLCEDLEEILFSLLTSLAPEDPTKWLKVCNQVLAASSEKPSGGRGMADTTVDPEEDEDAAKFTTGESEESRRMTKISPRWPTKVFAVECSRKIYAVCKSDPAHFDLSLAQQKKTVRQGDYLVMHLSELVRTSFIAATASVDQLKLAGYKALRDVIELFASTADPEFPGHLLLEQYQAQIGAALRPAFTKETAPHVTAMACQVCSEWLGSGVSRDVGDLKRVQQLLVSSLEKMSSERSEASQYGESVATMEGLAVLKAWAELYIKVTEESLEDGGSSAAMDLLNPHLPSLSKYWLAALRDHAHMTLPPEFSSQLPPNGGTFFTINVMEIVRPYYEANWSSLLHASAIWLKMSTVGKKQTPSNSSAGLFSSLGDSGLDDFHLVLGLAVQSLCFSSTLDQPLTLTNCLQSLKILVSSEVAKQELSTQHTNTMATELLSVLHRVLLTCSSQSMHVLALQISQLIGESLKTAEEPPTKMEGELTSSPAYSLLKVAACCLFRLIPGLESLEPQPTNVTKPTPLTEDTVTLVAISLSLLVLATSLCSPVDSLAILPSALHILLSSLQYTSCVPGATSATSAGLQTLRELCSELKLEDSDCGTKLMDVLRSALTSILESKGQSLAITYSGMSEETRLLVMAVFLFVSTPSTELCPPNSQLFNNSAQLINSSLNSSNDKVQTRALQICKSLFQRSSVSQTSVSFIHTVGPSIVKLLERCMVGRVELGVVTEATRVMEVLLEATKQENKSQMMNLLIPLYVSLLLEPSTLRTASKQLQQIHEHLLSQVTQIGPKYPELFRALMQGTPELNQRLKAAIQAGQSAAPRAAMSGRRGQTQQAPSIKLKMDFSNFK